MARGPQRWVALGSTRYRRLDHAPRDVWQRLADADPTACATMTPAWMSALTSIGIYRDVTPLYEAPDGRRFVVPLAQHLLRRHRGSLLHGWGMGGIVTDGELTPTDVTVIVDDLRRQGHGPLRPAPLRNDAYVAALSGVVPGKVQTLQLVDLRDGFDTVWAKAFSATARNYARRAERDGRVRVEVDRDGSKVDVFYSMMLRWVVERPNPRHLPSFVRTGHARFRDPLRKIRAVAHHLGDRTRLFIAYVDDEPVQAAYLLLHPSTATYWRVVNVHHLSGPSWVHYLVPKLMMQTAAAEGCSWFDLGNSLGIRSLFEFKQRLGGRPFETHEWELPSMAGAAPAPPPAPRVDGTSATTTESTSASTLAERGCGTRAAG